MFSLEIYFFVCLLFRHKWRKPPRKLLTILFLFSICLFLACIPTSYGGVDSVDIDEANQVITVYGSGPFNLTDINVLVNNQTLLNQTSPGIWFLNASLIVGNVSTVLEITNEDCTELRINTPPNWWQSNYVMWRGNITIANTTVYGWETSGFDLNASNGRSRLTSWNIAPNAQGETTSITNTTLAYLGNGTASTTAGDILNAYSLRVLLAASENTTLTVDQVTFHNCSVIYLYGGVQVNLSNTDFSDCSSNWTMFARYQVTKRLTGLTFNNCSHVVLSNSYDYWGVTSSLTLENSTFQNQRTDNSYVFDLEQSRYVTIKNVTVDNCKNNSILLDWNTNHTWVEDLTMNYTGRATGTGFWGRNDEQSHNLTVKDSIFRSVHFISTKWIERSEWDNVTVIGNLLGGWQYGIQSGNYSHIHDCNIYNVTGVGIIADSHSIVENNYVEESDTGIMVYGGNIYGYNPCENITIRGNTIYNTTAQLDWWACGIRLHGATNGSAYDILVENNTVTGGNIGILMSGGTHDMTIRNNTVGAMPWGTGAAYLPYNYTRPGGVSGWQNQSGDRAITGIGLMRQWDSSWNWSQSQNARYSNITIENNTYNGTYLQSYVWIDKLHAYNNSAFITVSETWGAGDYKFEFTDSFFNGSVAYMNPSNPIYKYTKADMWGAGGNKICHLALNATHFSTQVPNSSDPLEWWWYWGGDIVNNTATLSLLQNNDNITRSFRLHNLTSTEKVAVFQTITNSYPTIFFNGSGPSGNVSYWLSNSSLYGEPYRVYLNGVNDTTHWSYSSVTNTTNLNYTHSSEVDVEIVYLLLAPPVLVSVNITNMEGCGNWVFAEERYYIFSSVISDPNGYADIDTVKLNFTDSVNTIIAVYDYIENEWFFEDMPADYPPARIKNGAATVISATRLSVTFPIYFTNYIIDAMNVSINMYCNDTAGLSDGWETVAADYFHIYSLGGYATYDITNNASRLTGGDVFDLWAQGSNTTSSIIANLTFRNLQHIKLLPIFDFNTSINGGQVTYMLDYCIDDKWIEGLEMEVRWSNIRTGSKIELELQIRWYRAFNLIKSDFIYMFHQSNQSAVRSQTRYWIDLWFNKINASTTMGARINAYEYSMTDSSHPWLRWLTGSNWGANYSAPKQSMCFIPILDADGNLSSTKQIDLVRVRCSVAIAWIFGAGEPPVYMDQYVEHRDLDVFDLTLGTYPLIGVQTPVFDETVVPLMPHGGFIGAVVSALSYLGKLITDALGVGLLNSWNFLVSFLDTIAGALGAPGLFTFIFGLISQAWTWFVDSMAYLISLILIVFTVLTQTMGKFVNVLTMTVGQWLAMFQVFLGFLGGTYTAGINIWNDLSLWTWLTLAAILYPLYLAEVWATRGMDAAISQVQFLLNVFSMILHFLFTVIQWAITLVTSIIESIPIAE